MSKSFLDMILFLTKSGIKIVYTYVYYSCKRRDDDDSGCDFKKAVDFAGGVGIYAGACVAVFHKPVCTRICLCGSGLSKEQDARTSGSAGRSADRGERPGFYPVYYFDRIDRICTEGHETD